MNLGRRPLIAGNWKMFRGGPSGMSLAADCARVAAALDHVDLLIAPPFTLLAAVAEDCEKSRLMLAGQTMHTHVDGAFTGEVSGVMLKECGATHVLLGHSERRQLFGETDAGVAIKAQAALAAGLVAIVCVGETLAEREAGKTLEVVSRQLAACVAALMEGFAAQKPIIVAYEPVWAIGTGKTAGPAEAEEVHAALRAQLATHEPKLGAVTRILYGGSVKPDNAKLLLGCSNIDGALIGGASLDIASFGAIARDADAMHRSLS